MLRWTAVLLAAVVVTSALGFFALGGAQASPATPRPAIVPAPGPLTINPTTPAGFVTNSYSVGYAAGQVYFWAQDTAVDTTGTVHINDLNATRDSLVNPVQTWSITLTAGQNRSWLWGGHYLLPLGLQNGGRWNITFTTASGFAYANFTVHTYAVSVYAAQPAVLPGHPFVVGWRVSWTANGALFTNFTSLTLLAGFFNGVTTAVVPGTPMTLPTTSIGTANVTAPAAATLTIHLQLWANNTAAGHSEQAGSSIAVAAVDAPAVQLLSCLTGFGCATNTFSQGSPAYVIVTVTMTDTGAPFVTHSAPGLNVKFTFENNGIVVPTPAGTPGNLTTNATGGAAVVFVASSPLFSLVNPNQVVVTVTDPLNPTINQITTVDFFITAASAQLPRLQVALNNAQYYAGDGVTATWTLWGANASVTQGWSMDSWIAVMPFSGTLVAQGTLSGGAGSGTFSFGLASNLAGELEVSVRAHNASASITAIQVATVTAPEILLTPSETFYLPGDSVTVFVTTNGAALAAATLYETVRDSAGVTWSMGILTGTQIPITIPKVGAPNFISVSVAGQTAAGGLIAEAAVTLSLASGYTVSAGIATASMYSDGSYQPGQSVQISYQVSALGNSVLPKSFTVTVVDLSVSGGVPGSSTTIQTSSPTGKISITIPSNAMAGVAPYQITAYFGGTAASSLFGVPINPNPSVLNLEAAPNTGLTIGLIILIIAIVVVALVLYMLHRRRKRPVVMHPVGGSTSGPPSSWTEQSAPSTPTTPSTPTPSTPSQPPLPGPPGTPPT